MFDDDDFDDIFDGDDFDMDDFEGMFDKDDFNMGMRDHVKGEFNQQMYEMMKRKKGLCQIIVFICTKVGWKV